MTFVCSVTEMMPCLSVARYFQKCVPFLVIQYPIKKPPCSATHSSLLTVPRKCPCPLVRSRPHCWAATAFIPPRMCRGSLITFWFVWRYQAQFRWIEIIGAVAFVTPAAFFESEYTDTPLYRKSLLCIPNVITNKECPLPLLILQTIGISNFLSITWNRRNLTKRTQTFDPAAN